MKTRASHTLKGKLFSEQIPIQKTNYIYRVQHRIMEGDCQYDHGPRLVKTGLFYMDRYPVTNEKFKWFLDESGYQPVDNTNFLKHWSSGNYPLELRNHPVVWVSHLDACAYAAWFGMRLPRDEEWQLAAGGRQKTKWPWGNSFFEDRCNSSDKGTTPVDCFPGGSSPWGCIDMCGNTWEWVKDVIDDGQHIFTFIRGGSYYKASHFWHAEGGPQPVDFHLKIPLLNEGLNRNGTVAFRCVKDSEDNV